jgi:nucleoside permease NupC
MRIIMGVVGIAALFGLAFLLSNNKKHINRTVFTALALLRRTRCT